MKKFDHQDFQILELGSPGTALFSQLVQALAESAGCMFFSRGTTTNYDQIILLMSTTCYSYHCGLSDEVKDLFFDQLQAVTARIPASEFLIPYGDWNGHVGRAGTGYREVHGGMGYGRPESDVEGERILEYALAFDLLLGNTCFKKRDSHLTTYKSGNISHADRLLPFP